MELIEKVTTTKFDVTNDDLQLILPYILKDPHGKESNVVLSSKAVDSLVFKKWTDGKPETIIITPEDFAKGYTLYKANSKDDTITQSAPEPVVEKSSTTKTEVWGRTIDYITETDYTLNNKNNCLTNIFESNGVSVIIKRFLYRVDRVINEEKNEDYCFYAIALPTSEAEEREFLLNGWKIHPMFFDGYTKKNNAFMNRVLISKDKHLYETNPVSKSVTLEIVSGLQLLYFIEFGTMIKDRTEYRGIVWDSGEILVSNANINEDSLLIINGKNTGIEIPKGRMFGYVSKFSYDREYDWLFMPLNLKEKYYICDSTFMIPTNVNVDSALLWGGHKAHTGIFSFDAHKAIDDVDNSFVKFWSF